MRFLTSLRSVSSGVSLFSPPPPKSPRFPGYIGASRVRFCKNTRISLPDFLYGMKFAPWGEVIWLYFISSSLCSRRDSPTTLVGLPGASFRIIVEARPRNASHALRPAVRRATSRVVHRCGLRVPHASKVVCSLGRFVRFAHWAPEGTRTSHG